MEKKRIEIEAGIIQDNGRSFKPPQVEKKIIVFRQIAENGEKIAFFWKHKLPTKQCACKQHIMKSLDLVLKPK